MFSARPFASLPIWSGASVGFNGEASKVRWPWSAPVRGGRNVLRLGVGRGVGAVAALRQMRLSLLLRVFSV
ncbi:hypothetical protein V6Z12_D05G375200 [Gossypium hirsutum]